MTKDEFQKRIHQIQEWQNNRPADPSYASYALIDLSELQAEIAHKSFLKLVDISERVTKLEDQLKGKK